MRMNKHIRLSILGPILVGLLRGGASVGQGLYGVLRTAGQTRGNAGFTHDVNAFANERTITGPIQDRKRTVNERLKVGQKLVQSAPGRGSGSY